MLAKVWLDRAWAHKPYVSFWRIKMALRLAGNRRAPFAVALAAWGLSMVVWSSSNSLCCLAVRHGASDIFLHSEQPPAVPRQRRAGDDRQRAGELRGARVALDAGRRRATALDFDGSYVASDGTRFRVNHFRTLFRRGAVLRPIKTQVPGLETLGVPANLLASWVVRSFGLVLVTGPTGAGKSTHARGLPGMAQPELPSSRGDDRGPDRVSLHAGQIAFSRSARCPPTRRRSRKVCAARCAKAPTSFSWAKSATAPRPSPRCRRGDGHLVLATLHSSNVLDSLERLSRLFDIGEREGVLQLLYPAAHRYPLPEAHRRGGRRAAPSSSSTWRTRRSRASGIARAAFATSPISWPRGDNPANVTFLQSLVALVQEGRVTEATAMQAASNPRELHRRLRGIDSSLPGLKES